jgi:nucleotide-binding universal stress UspA family protein
MTTRPVVIGFDGTPVAERAVREAGALLAPRTAVVVVVWEAGRAFEAATTPAFEAPPVTLEFQSALAADQRLYEAAEQVARRGAALAKEAGLAATGLAVADEATVAETLMRVAQTHDAQAIAIGAHGHRGITGSLLGSTSRHLVQHAPCSVILVR